MSIELFQKIYTDNITPVARTNIAGEYLSINSAYEQLTGYTLAELQQLNYADITPQKWHAIENQHVLKEVFAKGETTYEKEYIHKSGEVIAIKAHVYLIKEGGDEEPGMWGTFTAF